MYDLVIIGGGAAGLMAATSAGRFGYRALVLEKNKKLGVKVLMSGGTRCNITHHCDRQGIVRAFGQQGSFLQSSLKQLPPEAVIQEIEAQGVTTKVEETGKIFPVSDRAIHVRDALVNMATQAGAELRAGIGVVDLSQCNGGFQVHTPFESISTRNVLVTTGGQSYPGCGTTGDGYRWAENLGHTIVSTAPALTPVLSNESWVHDLKGLTLPTVDVSVVRFESPTNSLKAEILERSRDSFLFTHFGFSGPSVLNVSRAVSRSRQRQALEMQCDWLPAVSIEDLTTDLRTAFAQHGKQTLANVVSQWFSRRFAYALMSAHGIATDQRAAEVSKKTIHEVVQAFKRTVFKVPGTLGFEKAEVTSGGVARDEVSSKTMESKIVPGLYFAGEVLDLDGPIGGYNFQSAFSTGFVAGQLLGQR